MKTAPTSLIGFWLAGTLGIACSSAPPADNGSGFGIGGQSSPAESSAGGVGGTSDSTNQSDVGGTLSNGGTAAGGASIGAGGLTDAGGTTGTGGLDAGNTDSGGLLQDAENYQGDYPQPGAVMYTDTDGKVITVPAIPGHVVLFVSASVTRADAGAMLSALGAEVRASFPMVGYYLAGTTPGSEDDLVFALRKDRRTLLVTPDIVVEPEVRELKAIDKCGCPHGDQVTGVLNKYTDASVARGICEPLAMPDAGDDCRTAAWSAASKVLQEILKYYGSAYMNISLGPSRKMVQDETPDASQQAIDDKITRCDATFWTDIFTMVALARAATKQPGQWDTVVAVSAGNDTRDNDLVDVSAAVQAVQSDPIAGGALATNGMIVGVRSDICPYSNVAPGKRDFVLGANPEADAGTSLAAPYALAIASNLATNNVSGTEAVCMLKRAAAQNNQVLPGRDLSGIDKSACLLRAKDVTAGETHSCTIHRNGTLSCWGFNAGGPLGNGSMLTVFSTKPVTVLNIDNAFAISAGYTHTCGLLSDGTIWCWGDNEYGQLGNNSALTSQFSYTPLKVWDGTGSTVIAAGGWHTCTVLRNGSAWCWGKNDSGQLGNGTTTNSPTPVAVASGAIYARTIAAGGSHTCAVSIDGTVWCWGKNQSGELGNGGNDDSLGPVPVSTLAAATAVSAGCCSGKVQHTCALLTDGTVQCWGDNEAGELGGPSVKGCTSRADSSADCSNKPVAVKGITGAIAVATGELHSCALLADGTVRCWGDNMNGELGDNGNVHTDTRFGVDATSSDDDYLPAQVLGISSAVAIAARGFHTCAVLADGSVWCWGMNLMGELGNGTQSGSPVPVMVSGS